jgi:pantetheine-phosphate adenylyltransferase
MRKAIFPGSFDPITLGHEDIIKEGFPFDEYYNGVNAEKIHVFPRETKTFYRGNIQDEPKVTVITYEGLTIDLCHRIKAILFCVVCVILPILNSTIAHEPTSVKINGVFY